MPSYSKTTRHQPHGFTLVELILVVIIVAVVGAIALPRFAQATARQQLSSAADRVAADLELARSRAIAASQAVTLTFDRVSENYQFNGVGGSAATVELDEAPYSVEIQSAQFGSGNVASFNGYGLPASSGYVVLSSGSGTVTVNLLTSGEVRR